MANKKKSVTKRAPDTLEFELIVKEFGGGVQVRHHPSIMPNETAKLACEFVSRWGMVASITDGEDSSGRQKLRLATPEEVVERAVTIAESLMDRLNDNGHLQKLPSLGEVHAFELNMKKHKGALNV